VVLALLLVAGCKRTKEPQVDVEYHHSPAGINEQIQYQQQLLSDALQKAEYRFIHDQAYYVQGLVEALAAKLGGEQKQRVDPILQQISRLLDEAHDVAGKRDRAATEAKLKELFDQFKLLEAEFPARKKEKK
jgi:hypothetical protein